MSKMQKVNGIPYYTELPDVFRIAVLEDFFYNGDLIVDKPYVVHSEVHPDRYYGQRTKPGFMEYNDFYLFLEKNRVFVLKNEN